MLKNILVVVLSFLFIRNVEAYSLRHSFDVFLGPFNASRTEFEYGLTKDKYHIESDVRTFGFFDSIYPFSAQYSTTGKIKGSTLDTTSYKYSSKSRFNRRSKELIYDDNGNPIYRLSSKNDKEKKVDIDQSLNTGDTTDLQTIFAKLALQYSKVKFCQARFEVFDGKRRFDVIFEDEGDEELQKSENIPQTVQTKKCSMYIDKLDSEGDDLLWQLTSDRPIYFWIAEEETNQYPYIARVFIENTPLGALNVYTTHISIKETN